jgi:hypothetical protein
LNASFFKKNWKEDTGRYAINRMTRKNRNVFIDSLFELL